MKGIKAMSTIPKSAYPSVDLAYPLALGAYDWAVKRFDAQDAKIQTIITIAVAVSAAFPVALSKLAIIHPWILSVGIVFFVLGLAMGTYARLHGHLILISPKVLHQKWLAMDESQF